MSDDAPRKPFFERLKGALEVGIQHARGEVSLRTAIVPEPPPALTAAAIEQLRKQLKLSQPAFAGLLNVSTRTVQSWEQGTRHPVQAALRLLQVFIEHPHLANLMTQAPANGNRLKTRRKSAVQ